MAQQISLKELLQSNHHYLQEVNAKEATYVIVNDEQLLNSSFLDARLDGGKTAPRFKLPIQKIVASPGWAKREPYQPGAYIFHLSHVGSTLLAKALGVADQCLSLREPVPLRNLATLYREAGEPHSWLTKAKFNTLWHFVRYHLGRPLGHRDEVLVKCTSWVNEMAPVILDDEQVKAVFLYCNVSNFLANILKVGGGMQDLLAGASARVLRLNRLQDFEVVRLTELSPGELGAMTWLVEMLSLYKAAERYPQNVTWCDFDHYLEDSVVETKRLAAFLGLSWTDADSQRLLDSNVLNKYSKQNGGRSFTSDDRASQLEKLKNEHAVEIEKGQRWLSKWATRYPALMTYA